jgi:hypothetical protein
MLSKITLSLLFILMLFGHASIEANYPIYILLTHPRATATAFEKVIGTHEDITVLHAPYLDPYLAKKYGLDHPFTKTLTNPSITYQDVTNHIFKLAEESPVFFKESGYVLIDYLKQHPEFYKNSQVKIAFLIRDPAKSVISFYRKMPSVDESIIGHKQLWDLFVFLKSKLDFTPVVIDSDEFLKNPIPILQELGDNWGIKFDEKNLSWNSGYSSDWRLKDWYVEVGASTRLEPYRGDVPREKDGTPLYEEVKDKKTREKLQGFYRSQNVYYQQLMQYALKP